MNHKRDSSNGYFEYVATNEGSFEYEKDVPSAPRRARIIGAATTTILIAGGLVGGAAFAMTSLPGQGSSIGLETATSASIQSQSVAAATVATDQSSASTQPTEAAKTIAVPPASFNEDKGERKFSKPAPSASASSSALPSMPPTFGGGNDDNSATESDHHDGQPRQPRGLHTPGLFTNADD